MNDRKTEQEIFAHAIEGLLTLLQHPQVERELSKVRKISFTRDLFENPGFKNFAHQDYACVYGENQFGSPNDVTFGKKPEEPLIYPSDLPTDDGYFSGSHFSNELFNNRFIEVELLLDDATNENVISDRNVKDYSSVRFMDWGGFDDNVLGASFTVKDLAVEFEGDDSGKALYKMSGFSVTSQLY